MLAVFALVATLAQAGAGALTGVVRDEAGAVVRGATVTVTAIETGVSRTVVSSAAGVYGAAGLAPGVYRVRVELTGFRPLVRDGVQVATGETMRVDLELAVGGLAELVTVAADASPLRREGASLGAVVAHEQVVQLPLNGRTFITLASLAAGVALPPNSQFPRINGGRPRTNEYLFDGISVLQPSRGRWRSSR